MADHDVLDEYLAAWLEPVSVGLTEEQLNQRRSAVIELAETVSEDRALPLTLAAHGDLEPLGEWLAETIRKHDATFVADGKEALLSVVAAAGLADVVSVSGSSHARVLALLIQSARFVGLEPAITELPSFADRGVYETFADHRARQAFPEAVTAEVQKILKDAGSTEVPAIQDWAVMSEHLKTRDKALIVLARRVDKLLSQVASRLAAADEELDVLWWSYTARSTSLGEPWPSVDPPERRALVAATELHQIMSDRPNLKACRALLALALGADVGNETTIGALAETIVGSNLLKGDVSRSHLLPLTSSADALTELGGKDKTWKTVAERTAGIKVASSCELLDGAEQWLRELEIRALGAS